MVKPYDPSPVYDKIGKLQREGHDVSDLKKCCPNTPHIYDAKDFKPYITAALKQFSDIMGLDVKLDSRY